MTFDEAVAKITGWEKNWAGSAETWDRWAGSPLPGISDNGAERRACDRARSDECRCVLALLRCVKL